VKVYLKDGSLPPSSVVQCRVALVD